MFTALILDTSECPAKLLACLFCLSKGAWFFFLIPVCYLFCLIDNYLVVSILFHCIFLILWYLCVHVIFLS